MKKTSCIVISLITSITIIILLAILLSVLLTLPKETLDSSSFISSTASNNTSQQQQQNASNRTTQNSCLSLPNKTFFAHRGGNISRFQENSLEVFGDSAALGRGIELDLMLLGSGEIVAFHDVNTLEKTGSSFELLYTPWEFISKLTYLDFIDGRSYASSPKIPLLADALKLICTLNKHASLWFDIKYAFDVKYIVALLDALEASPCACDAQQRIVVEVFRDVNGLAMLQGYMRSRRCNGLLGAISYYEYQIAMSVDTLKAEMDLFAKYASVIDFPADFLIKFPEILSYNANLGLCNSVYGDNNEDMDRLALDPLVNALIYNFYEPVA